MSDLAKNLKQLDQILQKLRSKSLSSLDRQGYEAWANRLRDAINAVK